MGERLPGVTLPNEAVEKLLEGSREADYGGRFSFAKVRSFNLSRFDAKYFWVGHLEFPEEGFSKHATTARAANGCQPVWPARKS
jgi:hypothetical protein